MDYLISVALMLRVKSPLVHVKIVLPGLPIINMAIDPRNIINSPFGLNLAYLIGKYTPQTLGQRIALYIADRISARAKWKIVHAVRTNQWVVNGEKLSRADLDRLVSETFRNIAVSIFELYHNINDPTASLRMFEPHPMAVQLLQRPEFSARGLVIAGVHMSNFDMAYQVGGLVGIKALTLTLPKLDAAYQKQLAMRSEKGLNIAQASVGSIKHAVDHLKAGGLVITGIDRPDENYTYRPKFFNRPAAIPIHHVFLAVKAHVPVIVVATYKHSDGKYHFIFSDPIEMQPHPDRHLEIITNAENILHVVEGIIQRFPSQWSMTFPVWPEVVSQVP